MPLIRLEVENFKSYRGQQSIGPFHTFSAVIGPNGSGKSNLMDAISFVLGVRSLQLRSSQLKDLIYRHGSGGNNYTAVDEDNDENDDESAHPSKASVTAVYHDSDEKEHLFKRSITLAGASEYRVNNRVLTANAYNERLKAFNILVKAKNFLVFQGDVESIASQSPKELSLLVDQISGSLEYKEAYEAAKVAQERAFEAQRYALLKRKGMNTEVNLLKGQKNEAERFKRLQIDRDSHVQHKVLWTLFHQQKKIERIAKALEEGDAKAPSLQKQTNDAEKSHNKRRKEHAQLAGRMLEQKKMIRSKEKEVERQQPDLIAIEEKIKMTKDKIANAEKLKKAIEPVVQKLKTEIVGFEGNQTDARARADEAAQEHASASTARGLNLSEADLTKYHQLKAEANAKATTERQKLELLSRDIKAKKGRLQSMEEKQVEAETKKKKLTSEEAALQERKAKLQEKQNSAHQSLSAVRSAISEAEKRKGEIDAEVEDITITFKKCHDQLLEASTYKRETEQEVKRKETIQTLQRNYPGVLGRLGDLCRPTQRKYETAISTVLGRNADAIVVQTQKDATDCIQYLKDSRSFQATFIPLSSIQVKEINDRLRSIATGARLAIDIIEFDPKLQRALQYACGNTIVCDGMALARTICYDKKQEIKAVTLEGTVIHKSGLISGGQSGETRGRRWPDQEVEGLERQRDDCLAKLTALGREKIELNRRDDGAAQVARLEVDLAALQDEMSSIVKQLAGARDEIKALDRQSATLAPRIEGSKEEVQELVKQKTELERAVYAEDDVIFADFCRRIRVGDIREYEEGQLKLMQQQNDARAQYEQQLKRLETAIEFAQSQLEAQDVRIEYHDKTITEAGERLKKLREERKSLKAVLDSITREVDEMKEVMKELAASEKQSSEAMVRERKLVGEAQGALDGLAKEVASLQFEMETVSTERLKLYRRCRLEEITLPLLSGSKELHQVPLEKKVSLRGDDEDEDGDGDDDVDDSMDLDETAPFTLRVPDYGIKVNFTTLSRAEKQNASEEMAREMQDRIDVATNEMDRLSPHIKANERLTDTESRLAEVDVDFEKSRKEVKRTSDEFLRLKKLRCDLYHKAFNHITSKIDKSYKELTKSKISPKGGSAYLILENIEEPYLGGLQFSAIPPAKTFRGIDNLSGGEKTMAAIALVFAIQSVYPAPFIILDEVDAALDSANVQRVADYIRSRASNELQFIVISHKASLYERSSALVGVMRNQQINSSATLTLDLEQYA
ncbi:hypothetical protein CBS101457_001501 [Exobasidium rhododendri]|nr:hypothetical protein CBS101457_001501 [Exobasidium rhododendri]